MGLSAKRESKYTWKDYLTWPDNERWEVIDGTAYNMTPSPTFEHQRIAGNFYSILRDRLRGKTCTPAIAPLDVYFDDLNFVQPDVMVICDRSKIRDRIYGAPDVIIEVLSPATSLKDKREKRGLYERYGVNDYVIADPVERVVERYTLTAGKYGAPEILNWDEVLKLSTPELEIDLQDIFEKETPVSGAPTGRDS